MGKVVRPTNRNWYAPEEWIGYMADNTPSGVTINAGGEYIDRPPKEIANYVVNGGVWVDYCGWPMYGIWVPGYTQMLRDAGFQQFLKAANMSLDFTFDTKVIGAAFLLTNFPYARSLRIWTSRPKWIIPNDKSPQFLGNFGLELAGPTYTEVYSNFAMKIGNGYYFYGYADDTGFGIEPENYSNFLYSVITAPPQPSEQEAWVPPKEPTIGNIPKYGLTVVSALAIFGVGKYFWNQVKKGS